MRRRARALLAALALASVGTAARCTQPAAAAVLLRTHALPALAGQDSMAAVWLPAQDALDVPLSYRDVIEMVEAGSAGAGAGAALSALAVEGGVTRDVEVMLNETVALRGEGPCRDVIPSS